MGRTNYRIHTDMDIQTTHINHSRIDKRCREKNKFFADKNENKTNDDEPFKISIRRDKKESVVRI